MTRHHFAFESRYRPILAVIGATPATAYVDVDDAGVRARFGLITVVADYANIEKVCVSGPYTAIKAIGLRLSLADRGLTMGTTTAGGVCLQFREPVIGMDRTGHLLHPGLTVTVEDVEGFAAEVRGHLVEEQTP